MGRKRKLSLEALERRELLSVTSAALDMVGDAAKGGAVYAPAALVAPLATTSGFSQATVLTPSATGVITQSGSLTTVGEVDYYKFVSPVAARLVIRETTGPKNAFTAAMKVYDANQKALTSIYPNPAGSLDSRIVLQVAKGSTYYLTAAAQGAATGSYQILTCTDDVGDTIPTSTAITLAAGAAQRNAAIEYPGDVDMYSVVATGTGTMTFAQNAAAGSSLDSYLYVFDSAGKLLKSSDDGAGTRNSLISLPVTTGMKFYVEAAAFGTSIGNYVLQFNVAPAGTPTVGHSFATATPIAITPDPTHTDPSQPALLTTQNGVISYAGQFDYYSFVAPVTGQMTVRQLPDASQNSKLASFLQIYDSHQTLVWQSSGNASNPAARINFSSTAGARYYAVASAHGGTLGAYQLQFSMLNSATDDYPNGFAQATSIAINPDGTLTQSGRVDYVSDVDMFQFVSPITGTLAIRETATASGLTPDLMIYDGNRILIAEGKGNATTVDIPVSLGATYFLAASGGELTAGPYSLQTFIDTPPVNVAGLITQLDVDGSISRADMIQILRASVANGYLNASNYAALKSMMQNAVKLNMPDYVRVLANDIINGNPANLHYQGKGLGNISVGSSLTRMYSLVDKWFFGGDQPTAGVSSSGAPAFDFMESFAGTPLFATAGPSYLDLHQGALGDCYLLASLGAIAKSSPAAIKNMFLDNGDGTWTVRFYANGVADYVTVDSTLAVDFAGNLVYEGSQPALAGWPGVPIFTLPGLWLPLAEKAYAQWNETGKEGRDGSNTYAGIEGGWPDNVMNQVLGTSVTRQMNTFTAADEAAVIAALKAGKAVAFTTWGVSDATFNLYGIVMDHVYAGVSYDTKADSFIVYNPWGFCQPTDPGSVVGNTWVPGPNYLTPGPITWAQLSAVCDGYVIDDTSGTLPFARKPAATIARPITATHTTANQGNINEMPAKWKAVPLPSTSIAASSTVAPKAKVVDLLMLDYAR